MLHRNIDDRTTRKLPARFALPLRRWSASCGNGTTTAVAGERHRATVAVDFGAVSWAEENGLTARMPALEQTSSFTSDTRTDR
jgi:hypothetical protein